MRFWPLYNYTFFSVCAMLHSKSNIKFNNNDWKLLHTSIIHLDVDKFFSRLCKSTVQYNFFQFLYQKNYINKYVCITPANIQCVYQRLIHK